MEFCGSGRKGLIPEIRVLERAKFGLKSENLVRISGNQTRIYEFRRRNIHLRSSIVRFGHEFGELGFKVESFVWSSMADGNSNRKVRWVWFG